MKLIYVLLFSILSSCLSAQHCRWDGSFMILISVKDSLSAQNINDLKLTLLDLGGKPVVSNEDWSDENNAVSYKQNEILVFKRNMQINNSTDTDDEHKPLFLAQDNYFLYSNMVEMIWNRDFKVKIADPKGCYPTKIIKLDNTNIISICKGESSNLENKILNITLRKNEKACH